MGFGGASWQNDEHNTFPKSTTRHVKLDKFTFGTPWLPDLLSKHWFASSVWNFCRWVADVPPHETSPAAKSEEKRMFSQANRGTCRAFVILFWKSCKCPSACGARCSYNNPMVGLKKMVPMPHPGTTPKLYFPVNKLQIPYLSDISNNLIKMHEAPYRNCPSGQLLLQNRSHPSD